MSSILGVSIVLAALPSHGVAHKRECRDAYESAQVARREARLLDSRTKLIACARTCPSVVSEDCARWLTEVEASLPSIVIVARDPAGKDVFGASIELDGLSISGDSPGKEIELDPGPHRLVVTSPSRSSSSAQDLMIVAGEKTRRVLVLLADRTAPILAPPPRPEIALSNPDRAEVASRDRGVPGGLPAETYVLGAGTLAAAFVALGFGLGAHFERSDLLDHCPRPCPDGELAPVRRNQIISDVALGAAFVLLGLTVWSGW
jgi:hypothetical protein